MKAQVQFNDTQTSYSNEQSCVNYSGFNPFLSSCDLDCEGLMGAEAVPTGADAPVQVLTPSLLEMVQMEPGVHR